MIRKNILIAVLLFLTLSLYAAGDGKYVVAFYNVENFFDIYDDPNVIDEEFTPDGPKEWTQAKYDKKLANISRVLYGIAAANKDYPAVIGLSEVENRRVLDDLVSTERLAQAGYQIVHYDSPEARGVDVALLYRPDVFSLEWSDVFQPEIPERPDFRTRDILAVCGTIDGERFCFFVNHWSSRYGGAKASEYLRVGCASTLRKYADSLMASDPDLKIVIMGDMNDDPYNRSLAEVIGAKREVGDVEPGGYFNPYWNVLKAGYGTLGYQDAWNLFDNIIVNSNLLEGGSGVLRIQEAEDSGFYGRIFKRSYMIQQKGKYRNYPLRSYSGNSFLGGYSDHLPVYIVIANQ